MSAVDTLTALLPEIEKVSRSVARDYPGVSPEDVYQELCVFVLEHGRSLKVEEEQGTRFILRRAAHIYAGKERAAQLHVSAQYIYRPEGVRRILETAFLGPAAWLNSHVPDDARSLKSGTDQLDVTFDVLAGMESLSETDQSAIRSRYEDGVVPENASAERKRLDRAVDRLTEHMNSYAYERQAAVVEGIAGHPGARRAITNAHASALIGRATDGE